MLDVGAVVLPCGLGDSTGEADRHEPVQFGTPIEASFDDLVRAESEGGQVLEQRVVRTFEQGRCWALQPAALASGQPFRGVGSFAAA